MYRCKYVLLVFTAHLVDKLRELRVGRVDFLSHALSHSLRHDDLLVQLSVGSLLLLYEARTLSHVVILWQ